jgi:hypothetical protein
MMERCEIDLSPATRISPVSFPPGLAIKRRLLDTDQDPEKTKPQRLAIKLKKFKLDIHLPLTWRHLSRSFAAPPEIDREYRQPGRP